MISCNLLDNETSSFLWETNINLGNALGRQGGTPCSSWCRCCHSAHVLPVRRQGGGGGSSKVETSGFCSLCLLPPSSYFPPLTPRKLFEETVLMLPYGTNIEFLKRIPRGTCGLVQIQQKDIPGGPSARGLGYIDISSVSYWVYPETELSQYNPVRKQMGHPVAIAGRSFPNHQRTISRRKI